MEKRTDLGPWFGCSDCRHVRIEREDGFAFTTPERCPLHLEKLKQAIRDDRRPRYVACVYCGQKHDEKYHCCEDCCEHEPDPDEGLHCLSCGKDCSEDVMARAYDRAKDRRKYGD